MLSNFKKKINPYLNYLHSFLINSFYAVFNGNSWSYLNSCDVLLVRHDHDCGYTFHNQAYAHIIDSFGDKCRQHGLTVRAVATYDSRLIGNKAYNSPVSYCGSLLKIQISGAIIGNLLGLLKGGNIKREWIESHYVDLWCQILKKATPLCIIGIQPDEYLCTAGKLLSIPVYDLQHGAIANDHLWYGEANRTSTPIEKLPDGFLCWDDQSAATIARWAHKKGIRILKVGNPWFLRFAEPKDDDQLVSEANVQIKKFNSNLPCILVTLQWELKKFFPDHLSNGIMSDSLEKAILETRDTYNWIIRLHPIQLIGMERDVVFKYLSSTFDPETANVWIKSSEIPLPVMLKKVDLHITDSSSTVIEAAWMGIPSGILNEQFNLNGKYASFFFHELSSGIANCLPHDPYVIKQWIAETLAKGHGESTLKDSGHNLDSFIDEIAARKT
nr:hypothetical protein [uncultured Methanoregula sp.]